MLHRKLLLTLGSLIVALVVAAGTGIALLHMVLEDLIHASTAAVSTTTKTQALEATAGAMAAELGVLAEQPAWQLAAVLSEELDSLQDGTRLLDERADLPADAAAHLRRIQDVLPTLAAHLDRLAVSQDATALESALAAATALQGEAAALSGLTRERSRLEFEQLVTKFRVGGLVAGIVSLLLLNVSIVVLLRAAAMILRPVDKLVDASRHLGREEFEYRVHIDQQDEFGELGTAYNTLAGQLQANEQRKVEVLHQVACTLSHELNNAISTIELQLTLMDRRSGGDPTLAEPLRQIHRSLGRMSGTIHTLQRVRKIVLTDYLSGIKMLDLQRSVEGETAADKAMAEMNDP